MFNDLKEIVVFGAGASHGARNPRPPLGADLHRYVLQYLDGVKKRDMPQEQRSSDIEDVTKILQSTTFYEAAVEKLLEENREQKRTDRNKVTRASELPPATADLVASIPFQEPSQCSPSTATPSAARA